MAAKHQYRIFKLLKPYLRKKNYVLFLNFLSEAHTSFYYRNENYFVMESGRKHYFLTSRGLRYTRGLKSLAQKIAQSYNIDGIEISESDYVIDVGANNGDLLLFLPKCVYIGFEPSTVEFNILRLNCIGLGEARNQAVGNFTGKTKFYISSDGANSSVYEPLKVESITEIEQIKLDDFISQPVKLLKIEAEGAELEVLLGAEKSLSKIQYIAVDASFEKGKELLSPAVDIINYLYAKNFELIALARKERYLFKNRSTNY
jgi:FkbM family methyltransferase